MIILDWLEVLNPTTNVLTTSRSEGTYSEEKALRG